MKIISFICMLALAMCLMVGCRMGSDTTDTMDTTTTTTTNTTATTTTATKATTAPTTGTTGTTEPSSTTGNDKARMPQFGFNGR